MTDEQSTNRDHFNLWFKEILKRLYPDDHAGFAIMMVTLPLLERYLRNATKCFRDPLNEDFHKALVNLFPSLQGDELSKKFWKAYRHGLLHRATLKTKDVRDIIAVEVHNNVPEIIDVSTNNVGLTFRVSPVFFSQKVISEIEANFATFEEGDQDYPLAQVAPEGFSGVRQA